NTFTAVRLPTPTVTAPAACAGTLAVTCVSDTTLTAVAGTPPNVTAGVVHVCESRQGAIGAELVEVIVTRSPPRIDAALGEIAKRGLASATENVVVIIAGGAGGFPLSNVSVYVAG